MDDKVLHWFAEGSIAVLLAIMGWLGRRHVRRIDNHSERLQHVEKTCVTREELQGIIDRQQDDRKSMHNENLAAARETRAAIGDLQKAMLEVVRDFVRASAK